ncbi:MAG: chitobiase/beta-hexosaminidase C-terminal domain-containing protein [Verrucomicrobiales bacterium]|nr:chitobiase/beta-hexosaminidase C-terminal domain-containing protein [Verrucomicrobiales bacterium]
MCRVFLLLQLSALSAFATTDKYRAIWNDSPGSAITIAWCQVDGDGGSVSYRPLGSKAEMMTQEVDHKTSHHGLESRFVRLGGLEPDTGYEFVIKDSNSSSPGLSFKTAPAGASSFSFAAGGDSRNHRDARQRANRIVAKLRPLFVCFGGDMINKSTPEEWSDWLDDWQLTTGADGHMIPIIAARGNHEGPKDIHSFFDTPIAADYYAVDFGSGFLRVYTLNTNITRAGSQGKWLAKDLAANAGSTWKIAHYHHPFRPHQSGKAEQHAQYKTWAPLFFEHGMDLAIECDSHVVKRTWPVRPTNEPGSDQGFIRDDEFGITFIGEGCWGAPLRRNDDNKNWTRASDSFNQVNWVCVTPEKIFARSIKADSVEAAGSVDPSNPFTLPEGMELWEPETGGIVTLLPRGEQARPTPEPLELARLAIIAKKKITVHIEIDSDKGVEKSDAIQIRFTLDGSDPTSDSPLYTGPFQIKETTTVRAAIFKDSQPATAISEATIKKE